MKLVIDSILAAEFFFHIAIYYICEKWLRNLWGVKIWSKTSGIARNIRIVQKLSILYLGIVCNV